METGTQMTAEQYIAQERVAHSRNAYVNGRVVPLEPSSGAHETIRVNIVAALQRALEGHNCQVYASNMRVRVPGGIYTYPDVVVACGKKEFEDQYLDTLLNPSAIIEITPLFTGRYNQWSAFYHYRQIPTLQEYVAIDDTTTFIEHFRRVREGWLLTDTDDPKSTLSLDSLDLKLGVPDIYAGTNLPAPER